MKKQLFVHAIPLLLAAVFLAGCASSPSGENVPLNAQTPTQGNTALEYSHQEIGEIYLTATYFQFLQAYSQAQESAPSKSFQEAWAEFFVKSNIVFAVSNYFNPQAISAFAGCTGGMPQNMKEYSQALCKASFVAAGNSFSMFAFETSKDASAYLDAYEKMVEQSAPQGNSRFESKKFAGECEVQEYYAQGVLINVNAKAKNAVLNLYGAPQKDSGEKFCEWVNARKSVQELCLLALLPVQTCSQYAAAFEQSLKG